MKIVGSQFQLKFFAFNKMDKSDNHFSTIKRRLAILATARVGHLERLRIAVSSARHGRLLEIRREILHYRIHGF